MKTKVKKCPKCGFKAILIVVKKIKVVGATQRKIKVVGATQRKITINKVIRALGVNGIFFWVHQEQYNAMKNCPHCRISLEDVPEKK